MILISNEDYKKAVRLLTSFSISQGDTRRDTEERRQARLLIRKWERLKKSRIRPVKERDDKFIVPKV